MRLWAKALPLFLVGVIAKKYGERFYDERAMKYYVAPYKGVRFYLEGK